MAPVSAQPVTVRAEHIDPAHPSGAASSAVGRAFALLPPARELLIAVVTWGDRPGVGVANWTLEGVRSAADHAGLRWQVVDMTAVDPPATRKLAWDGVDASGRCINLDVAGGRRPRRIPTSWIGKHLCLVTPCLHLRERRRGRNDTWTGPTRAALATLARSCAQTGDQEPPEVGARLAASIFASMTIVVDATWWGVLDPEEGIPAELVELNRCLALSSAPPSEAWGLDAPAEVDAWIERRLQVGPTSRGRALDIELTGSGVTKPWPKAPAPLVKRPRRGLAGQAMESLWTAGRRRMAHEHGGRLPPSAPGTLARQWVSFHELRGPKLTHAPRLAGRNP